MFKSLCIKIIFPLAFLFLAQGCKPIPETETDPFDEEIPTKLNLSYVQSDGSLLSPVIFTATIIPDKTLNLGAPTGTVEFKVFDNNAQIEKPTGCAAQILSNDIATCPITFEQVGNYKITAVYSGQKDEGGEHYIYNGSQTSIDSYPVNKMATQITFEDIPKNVLINATFPFKVKLSRADNQPMASAPNTGKILLTIITPPAGMKFGSKIQASPVNCPDSLSKDGDSYSMVCDYKAEVGGASFQINAAFSNDAKYANSSGPSETITVQDIIDSSTILEKSESDEQGSIITTFKATVTVIDNIPSKPLLTSGYVKFEITPENGRNLPSGRCENVSFSSCDGDKKCTATCDVTFFGGNEQSYTIKADYSGEANIYKPSAAPIIENYKPGLLGTELTITGPLPKSPAYATPGNKISVAVRLSRSAGFTFPPTGNLFIEDVSPGGTLNTSCARLTTAQIKSSSYDLTCTFDVPAETKPDFSLRVHYSGDSIYEESNTETFPLSVINPTKLGIAWTADPLDSEIDETVTFTATVSELSDGKSQKTKVTNKFTTKDKFIKFNKISGGAYDSSCLNAELDLTDNKASCDIIFHTKGPYEICATYADSDQSYLVPEPDCHIYTVGEINTQLDFEPEPASEINVGEDLTLHVVLSKNGSSFDSAPGGTVTIRENIDGATPKICDNDPEHTTFTGKNYYICTYTISRVPESPLKLNLLVNYTGDGGKYASQSKPLELTVLPIQPELTITNPIGIAQDGLVNHLNILANLTYPHPEILDPNGTISFYRDELADDDEHHLDCDTSVSIQSRKPIAVECPYTVLTPFDTAMSFYAKYIPAEDNLNFKEKESAPVSHTVHKQAPSIYIDCNGCSVISGGSTYTITSYLINPLADLPDDWKEGEIEFYALYEETWIPITSPNASNTINCNPIPSSDMPSLTCRANLTGDVHAIRAVFNSDNNIYYKNGCSIVMPRNESAHDSDACPSTSYTQYDHNFFYNLYPWNNINLRGHTYSESFFTTNR